MTTEIGKITEFFENQTVFITGGTGFLGKVLIEKLLRKCQNLKKIYMMVRPKKGKTAEERFRDLFELPCFDHIRDGNSELLEKVSLIYGNCGESFLGIGMQDIEILKEEVTCVIHAAANVKFDQTLREATSYVKATKDLLEIAREMKNLKVFVYISTFYSNCPLSHIEEKIYKSPMEAEDLFGIVDNLEDDILVRITPKLIKKWPNAYTFTKSIVENLVASVTKNFPVAIVRPAIVFSSVSEPITGWIDNFNGVVGLTVGVALGVIRGIHANPEATAFLVPVDYVCNCILASAWDVTQEDPSTTIYNYVGSKENLITWRQYLVLVEPHCWEAASEKVLWYFCFKLTENAFWHKIRIFLLHTVPAYIVDFVFMCIGRPQIAVENYRKLNKMLDLLNYFSVSEWSMDNMNIIKLWSKMTEADRKMFFFDMSNLNWDNYLHGSVFGARRFLLKQTLDSIPAGKRKLKILCVAHYSLMILLSYLLFKFVMFVVHLVW